MRTAWFVMAAACLLSALVLYVNGEISESNIVIVGLLLCICGLLYNR